MVVAFLGLGAIGTPMAAHLARRWQLTVFNRTRAGLASSLPVTPHGWPTPRAMPSPARELLQEADVPGPLVDMAETLLSQVGAELGEEADYLEAVRWIENRAGIVIRG